MKRFAWLFCALAVAGFGCGDDDDGGDGSGTDDMAMAGPVCPANAPAPEELQLPCCYRVSNADRQEAPEFRVTNLKITQPTSLGSDLVLNVLAQAVEQERFNWLMAATVDGDSVTVQTGYGEWNAATTSYSFVDGAAPAEGGDPDRWNPVVIDGTLDGEEFTAPAVAGSFAVPVFNEAGTELDLELPLSSFEVISATFSEDRTCIGTRTGLSGVRNNPSNYVSGGEVRTYITMEAARQGYVSALNSSLCNLISGSDCVCDAADPECTEVDPTEFDVPLDATCDEAGACTACTAGSAECNAWTILGSFAAAGVEIE